MGFGGIIEEDEINIHTGQCLIPSFKNNELCKTTEIYIHISNKSSSRIQNTHDLIIKNKFEEL